MSYQDIAPLIITEIVGDFGFKQFANYGGFSYFTMGSLGYLGVIYYLIRSLQGSQLLLVNAAWDGLSALIESIAAILILGERFDDPIKYMGIVFILIGLFMLQVPLLRKEKFIFPKL
jgi:multidrug transporter EmrE-like cation transporter